MAAQGAARAGCPSTTPWEAGCTWSRRKEGEEVRLQEFPGAPWPAEIMGMRRKAGGGANGTENGRRAPAWPATAPQHPQPSGGTKPIQRSLTSLPLSPCHRKESRGSEREGRLPTSPRRQPYPYRNCQTMVLPEVIKICSQGASPSGAPNGHCVAPGPCEGQAPISPARRLEVQRGEETFLGSQRD